MLSFTVASSVPVEGNRGSELDGDSSGLGVRVLVAEDGNVDVDADGLPEAGSGVLLAAQEGERSVVIRPGESEVVVAVETVGAAGSGSVTVTVTVLEPDGGEYAVAPGVVSASTVVRDDGADAVVFWSAADSEPILATRPVELVEDDRLDLVVRVVTDAAVEPGGFFSLQTSADPGTAALIDYERLHPLVHFGSGPGANPDAVPFSLTSDGLRYTAAAPVRFFTRNDDQYELTETLKLVVERSESVPVTVRLAGGSASRLPILLFDNDDAEADIIGVEPGDGTLSVTWEYARHAGPFVQQTELQWRRSGQTDWPADGTGLFATGTTAEISGLDNGVEYELRARPIVPDGRSRWPYDDFRLGTGTPRSDVTTPSVGISAGATEAAEGTALRFTVRTGAPVTAAVDVAVVVAEDGNIDTDNDGTADESSGVLPAAQEGRRSVTIPAGAAEAVLSVLTAADEAWENHATVTVTVSPSDNSAYVVDAAASSASTRVRDDDVPAGEISLRVGQGDVFVGDPGEFDNVVSEDHGVLFVKARFVTDTAAEPHGVFGVRLVTFPGTTDSDFVAAPLVLSFGSGDDAPAGAVPFALSDDGLRYEAVATGFVAIVNDGLFELNEMFDIALERMPSLPASVRLGAGNASRVSVTIVDDESPVVYFDERENPPIPGDGQLTVAWKYDDDLNDYVTQFAVRWRRSDGTSQSERREWGSAETERIVDSAPGVYTDEGTIDIIGLENGVLYEIGVHPIVEIGNYQIGEWRVTTGTPGIDFRIASDTSPLFVRGGGVVERELRLVYDDDSDSADLPYPVPFANRSMGARILTGPSTGQSVQCRPHRPPPPNVLRAIIVATGDAPRGRCSTDADGLMTLVYDAARVSRNAGSGSASDAGSDYLTLHANLDGDDGWRSGEPQVRLDVPVQIVRPINYVALGDSYSSGENGGTFDFVHVEGLESASRYGNRFGSDTLADSDCRRWKDAYPQVFADESEYLGDAAELDLSFVVRAFYACAGATTEDIFSDDPDAVLVDGFNGQSLRALGSNNGLDQSDRSLDIITLTIGGNDIKFSEMLRKCFTGVCGEEDVEPLYTDLTGNLRSVLAKVNSITSSEGLSRRAAIFVLGYPNLVPPETFNGTEIDLRECRSLDAAAFLDAVQVGLIDLEDLLTFFEDFSQVMVENLGIIEGPLGMPVFGSGTGPAEELASEFREFRRAGGRLFEVSDTERDFVRTVAARLNGIVKAQAEAANVHYVDVADAFEGHWPCGDDDLGLTEWVNGLVPSADDFDVVQDTGVNGVELPISGASFHPNRAGQRQYARILREYIAEATARGVRAADPTFYQLNNAGLPANPAPPARVPRRAGSSLPNKDSPAGTTKSSAAATARSAEATAPATPTATALLYRRVAAADGPCDTWFGPGDQVEFLADGFAADSAVTFSVLAGTAIATAPGSTAAFITGVNIPAATADERGDLEVTWTLPDAPAAEVDAAPRWYLVKATGTDPSGGNLVAYSPRPVVVYPGAATCATDDAATTSLGTPVRVAVLTNDTAPVGGSLVAASVRVEPVAGGRFAVNATDGSLTFTPDPGFVGTARTRYWVYDTWSAGVAATVAVTVDAGCTVTGAADATVIEGTDGDDVICVQPPDDPGAVRLVDAKAGNDIVLGSDGVDWIFGGPGDDVVYARGGRDEITGGAGLDTIHGGQGFDAIHSADLADTIIDDVDGYELLLELPARPIHAAPVAGDDESYAMPGETADIAVLDNDFDPNGNLVASSLSITRAPTVGRAVVVSTSAEVAIRYTAGTEAGVNTLAYEICDTLNACASGEVTVTVGSSHCTIVGTDGDDVLRGTAGADVICGLGGDDTIYGLDGDDILIGGLGDDTLYGGDETRIGVNDGDDRLFGGAGEDTLAGGNGNDTLWGGPDDDTLEGNRRDDTLIGGPGDDSLNGGGENDTLFGGAGDDTLVGHARDDTLHGGPGNDSLTGGNGDDVIYGGPGEDSLNGGAGGDTLWGGPGGDRLWGNTQNDTLYGGPGDDTLRGGGHDDHLLGGPGGDRVWGDAGNDHIWGDSGDDRLDGGNGTNYINGGGDSDNCTRAETSAQCEQRIPWF